MTGAFKIVDLVVSPTIIRTFILLQVLYLLYQIGLNAQYFGTIWPCWDYMLISGSSAFIIALSLAIPLPRRFDETINKLRAQNTLIMSDSEVEAFKRQMAEDGKPKQFWSGLLIVIVIFGSFVWVFGSFVLQVWAVWQANLHPDAGSALFEIGLLTLISVTAALWSGVFFGRLTQYGMLADTLSSSSVQLRIRPGHFDSAAGLKPVGDFYLYQAFLLAIPILWLGLWWAWVIPVYKNVICSVTGAPQFLFAEWQEPFFVQWLVVLAYFFFGFVKPIFKLKRRIKDTKTQLNAEDVPKIKRQLLALQSEKTEEQTDSVTEKTQEADRLAHRLWQIKRMPNWPMDATTLRRYATLVIGEGMLPLILDQSGLNIFKPIVSILQ